MILLATDKILKKQFVEHLVFVVLKEVFNPKKQDIGNFLCCHYQYDDYENSNCLYGSNIMVFIDATKQIRYKTSKFNLCNPEECVKLMKLLENVAYSYIDWWYKYYITKELR